MAVFLDLGANIGAFSLMFAANGWHGYAFEADETNTSLLRKSVMLNDYDIEIFENAVSDKTGTLSFFPNGPCGIVITEVLEQDNINHINEIPCVALDDLLDNAFSKVEEINLIKMDIEGSEVAALRGMSKLVKRFKYPPIYIEINAYTLFLLSETPYSLLKTVDDLGYKTYIMNDDNTLSTYPIDTFSTDVLMENVLLFKELPANLTVVPKIYPNSSEMIDWIVEKCSNIENFKHPMEYILYALKDFPQYYNEPRINKLLSKIATSENNDDVSPHINKAIDWFRIMQKDK